MVGGFPVVFLNNVIRGFVAQCRAFAFTNKVCSLCPERAETDLYAACQGSALHVRAWQKLKMLCVAVD